MLIFTFSHHKNAYNLSEATPSTGSGLCGGLCYEIQREIDESCNAIVKDVVKPMAVLLLLTPQFKMLILGLRFSCFSF